MDWSAYLEPGEQLRWEGRPAPRCFTFRHWRQALYGMLLFLLSVFWQIIGIEVAKTYEIALLGWVPFPFILLGLYLGFGPILRSRLEWEKVFYGLTDRRLIVRRGIRRDILSSLPLDALVYFRLDPLGENLGTIRVWSGEEPPRSLVLPCLEAPRRLTDLLRDTIGTRAADTTLL